MMKPILFFLLRLSLLFAIGITLVLIFVPETFDMFKDWQDGKEVISETRQQKREDYYKFKKRRSDDIEIMVSAINTDLAAVKYIFNKSKYVYARDKSWWPPLLSLAIEADKLDVVEYFLEHKYICQHSNKVYGKESFRAAINAESDQYLKLLLSHSCLTEVRENQESLLEVIRTSNYPNREGFLNKEPEIKNVLPLVGVPTVSRILCTENLDRQFFDESYNAQGLTLGGKEPVIFINRVPAIFNQVEVTKKISFNVYTKGIERLSITYAHELSGDKQVVEIESAKAKNTISFDVAEAHYGKTTISAKGYTRTKVVINDDVDFCIPRQSRS